MRCFSAIPRMGFSPGRSGTLIVVGVLSGVSGVGREQWLAGCGVGGILRQCREQLLCGSAVPGECAGGRIGFGDAAGRGSGDSDPQMRAQAGAILAEGLANNGVPSADSAYLAQLVSAKTGLPPADAQARVSDVLNREQAAVVKAKQVADASRKAASAAAVYTFVALLIGAFIASVAGAIGRRLRDWY